MRFLRVDSFQQWRELARNLLVSDVPPSEVRWNAVADEPSLFDGLQDNSSDDNRAGDNSTGDKSQSETLSQPISRSSKLRITVPPVFMEAAQIVTCHRSQDRWNLLYRTLWRLCHGERNLMEITTDDDVYAILQMKKAITRDVHKMKAFVRFRKVVTTDLNGNDSINYIAWHQPDHKIVRLAAPFFSRRFKEMNWTILTPDESVSWDQRALTYGPGVPVTAAPESDELEELWKTYYASIFNPARIKTKAMIREMPKRHWATLPEAEIIEQLLSEAPSRVEQMIEQHEGFHQTAANFIPEDRADIVKLREAATRCQACDLCHTATQTVFGVGKIEARLVLVGEQPGDQEDLAGLPFVGPAGRLLNSAISHAGFDRDQVYITNVVKHFKFIETASPRGVRRLHQKPSSREIFACRPWLEAELTLVRPQVIVCLGTTAAQALIGRDFRITAERGRNVATNWCENTIATWHPSAILRQTDESKRELMTQQLVLDLKLAWQQANAQHHPLPSRP